jgi:hypothetical protein
MKRLYALGFVAALLAATPGCSKNDPDSLTKQSISDMNDLASAIEKKESTDKIKSMAEKLKATQDKIVALKLSPDDSKKLMEKYQKEMMDALSKLMKAAMGNPEAMAALSSVGGLGDKIQVSSGGSTPGTTTTGSGGSAGTPSRTGGKK